jgi:short-chain fatty acids transporter
VDGETRMQRIRAAFARVAERRMPDPFVLALGLTAVSALVFLGAGEGVPSLAATWMAGASSPAGLAFALQMSLVLVTGHALASSAPVRVLIRRIAARPASGRSAVVVVAFCSCVASLVHWGLGAVCGALLAREMGSELRARLIPVHYPLLGAAGYAGFAVWHGGLSGSAPLKVAEPGHFLASTVGVLPLTSTVASPLNLVVTGGLLVLIPLLLGWMAPDARRCVPPPVVVAPAAGTHDAARTGWADRGWAVCGGATLVVAVLIAVGTGRAAFDINAVNGLFFGVGLVAQGGVRRWLDAVAEGARGAGAVITQFPLYFGIIELLRAAGTLESVSVWLAANASATLFPVVAYVAASAVNLVVPSGGGQWAVQGPVLMEAGHTLGVAPETTVLAFAWGDASSNLLQPFWALPLLAILGLRAGQIVGYTAVVFCAMSLWVIACLSVWGAVHAG